MNDTAREIAGWSLALALIAAPAVAAAAPQSSPSVAAAPSRAAAQETRIAADDSSSSSAQSGSKGSLSDFEKAQDTSGYNSEYLFALTRGLANSSINPAGKVPLFIFTLPLDVVFLPFAAIAGLFG